MKAHEINRITKGASSSPQVWVPGEGDGIRLTCVECRRDIGDAMPIVTTDGARSAYQIVPNGVVNECPRCHEMAERAHQRSRRKMRKINKEREAQEAMK